MRSDEERLEIIRQTQKLSHAFDGIDTQKLAGEAMKLNLRSRAVFHTVLNAIISLNHSLLERIRIDWRSCNTEHIKTCEKCQKLLGEVIMHLGLTHGESK